MTLMCIDRSQSPTHKGNFLQGRKSPVNNNSSNNNNNNNINQQNANNNNNSNNNNNHHRRNSCSPPLSKTQDKSQQQQQSGNPELSPRKLERSTSEPVERRGSGGQLQQQTTATNSSRYKTELCRPFEENGTCKYGDKCQFAHGAKELRSMARHPKYKTELCRTFHSTGLCPYGPRCHFIHNSEQSKKSLLTNLTTPTAPLPSGRQKALSSLGSAGDVSPVSSHGGTPTGMKSFDDLYKQQQPAPLSPVSIAQTLVNNLNFELFAPAVDCCFSSDAFGNFIADAGGLVVNGVGQDSGLDNYGYSVGGGFEYSPSPPVTPGASDESVYLRLPIFNRIQSKQ